LDTNACIHVFTGRVPSVRECLQAIPPEQIGVSAVVVAELQFGISLAKPLPCPALHRNRVLVTQNLREFERLQGLSLEEWSGSSTGA